jgi:hypothetical protein
VPTLVALVLIRGGRFTPERCARGTAALWAIKLVLTSLLYTAIAPGAVRHYEPARPWLATVSPDPHGGKE